MEKQQLINEIKLAISNGIITTNEISSVLSVPEIIVPEKTDSIVKRLNLSEIFYYIGGIIVLIGIVILVGQNWRKFTYPIRVFTTFGMGIIFFISAILLTETELLKKISSALFLISAILIPFGYFVVLADNITRYNINFYNTLIPFLCLLQFGAVQFAMKKDIFTLFNTIFATWLFFGLTNIMITHNPTNFNINFHLYRVMLVGISYMLVGYYLKIKVGLFSGWLNTFGVMGIMIPGFILNVMAASKYGPDASVIWIFLYPLMIIISIISSVYIKNSALLFVGTLSLIAYIIRVTAQNFADTIGWPIVLIFLGIVVMGLGYIAFYLNKKYIKVLN